MSEKKKSPSVKETKCRCCPHGHEMTAENTYTDKNTGAKSCIECRRIRAAVQNAQMGSRYNAEQRALRFFAKYSEEDIAEMAAILAEREERLSRRNRQKA